LNKVQTCLQRQDGVVFEMAKLKNEKTRREKRSDWLNFVLEKKQ